MDIVAILTAAAELAPVVEQAVSFVEASIAGKPVSSAEADTVFSALTQASAEAPILAPILPIVQKQFNGQALDDADIAQLEGVSSAIDAQIAAKTAAIEAEAE